MVGMAQSAPLPTLQNLRIAKRSALDGSQISNESARVIACEAEGRHVGVSDRDTFAQALEKGVEVDAAIKRSESRCLRVRTGVCRTNGVTLCAERHGQKLALLDQLVRLLRLAR